MPEVNGFDVVVALREEEATAHIPIMVSLPSDHRPRTAKLKWLRRDDYGKARVRRCPLLRPKSGGQCQDATRSSDMATVLVVERQRRQ